MAVHRRYATKRPRIGDRRWVVEWCSRLAFYENSTDVDRDACTMSHRCFPGDQYEQARAFAESIWPGTQETFGIVELDEQEYRSCGDEEFPLLGNWVFLGEESHIFSGEWES